MHIIPSLVENSPRDLFEVISKLSLYFSRFQIDIEDGVFVPHKTLALTDLHQYILQNKTNLNKTLFYDFHLMETLYEPSIEKIVSLSEFIRVDTVLIHTKLKPDYRRLSRTYPQLRIGLVINPEEDVISLFKTFDMTSVPIIQIMTVHPGEQGQPFIPEALDNIQRLRKEGYNGLIYLDGGINEYTLDQIMARVPGPDVLCPGSFLARATDLEVRIKQLTAKGFVLG